MSGQSTGGTDRDDGLKNPMRFSIRNRRIDIENYLRHPDFDEKQVTEIVVQDGQIYVHWDWSTATGIDHSDSSDGE